MRKKEVTSRLVVPAFVAFAVDHVPPPQLDELAAHDILDDPEVDACEHKHQDVCEGIREHNGQEEVATRVVS